MVAGAVGFNDQRNHVFESLYDLFVVNPHTYNRFHTLFNQVVQQRVVVPFVRTAQNQYSGFVHALQRIPGAIHIGGLAVVDELNAPYHCYKFHPVFQAMEILHCLPYLFLADADGGCGYTCCHSIIMVVFTF